MHSASLVVRGFSHWRAKNRHSRHIDYISEAT